MSHSVLSRCPLLSAMTLAVILTLNLLPVALAESPPNTAIVPVPKLENDEEVCPAVSFSPSYCVDLGDWFPDSIRASASRRAVWTMHQMTGRS